MATNYLDTGDTGRAVSAESDGALFAGIFGSAKYVLENGSQLKAEVQSNNIVKISDGDAVMYGRHVRIPANDSALVTINNGHSGTHRIDLIVFRYTKDSTGKETVDLVVIQGEDSTGTATAPTAVDGNILTGAMQSDFPLYSVELNGINIVKVNPLFNVIGNISKLKEELTELNSKLTETTAGLSKANNSLGVIGTQYFGKTASYSYRNANNWVNNVAKVTLPKGTYIFTITAKPQALGQNLDAFALGVTGVSWWEAQSTSLIYFGSGFYPTCTHTFVASVNAGTYGLAIWSSHNRTVNDVEIMATRIK